MNTRAEHEIKHGEMLSSGNEELFWGWGTPAGKVRAKRRADLIAKGAQLNTETFAMEIGCGSGMFTEMFIKTGAKLIAVDISPDLLAKARSRNLPSDQVQFLEKRFEDCDMEGPFDAIIGSSILHHIDIMPSFFKIYELLRPGGVMSFAEPNWLNPQIFIERKFRKWFPYVSPDEKAFVRWKLMRDLKEVGFEKIKITPFDWLHPLTPKLMIKPVSILGNIVENVPLLKDFSGSLYICAYRPN